MNRVICIFLFFSFVLSIWACSGAGAPDKSLKIIPAEKMYSAQASDILLTEISDKVRIVIPEDSDDAVIGKIKKICLAGDRIFIGEDYSLAQFDKGGKFIGRIGSTGRGPGEYLHISEFFITPDGEWICDLSGKKIICYDREGNVLQETGIPRPVKDLTNIFLCADDEFVAFTPDMGKTGKEKMLSFFTSEGIVADSVRHPYLIEKIKATIAFGFREGQFIAKEKDIKFKCVFNDTVYRIAGRKLLPEYVFDLGDLKANRDARVELAKDYRAMPMAAMAHIELLGESSRYLFFSMNDEPLYFYDKKENRVYKWRLILPDSLKKEYIAPEDTQQEPVFTPLHIDENGNLIGIARAADENRNPAVVIAGFNR